MENQKILAWEEIFEFLTKSQLQQVASQSLRNEIAEQALAKYDLNKRELNILTLKFIEHEFTNLNWQYYLAKFRGLQPKELRISSLYLDNLSNLKELQSLEVFELYGIGEVNLPHLIFDNSKLVKVLKEVLAIPSLSKINLRCFFKDYRRSEKLVKNLEELIYLEKKIKNKFSRFEKNYFSFSFSV